MVFRKDFLWGGATAVNQFFGGEMMVMDLLQEERKILSIGIRR